MSIIGSNILAGASGQAGGGGAAGYQIERSLRFNSSDSAYLSRTPASAGNRRTWTWAGWVKLSSVTTAPSLFMCRNGGGDSGVSDFIFNSDGTVVFTGAANTFFTTTQVLRDFSAWYHLVLSVDTTAATAGNRIRFYLNGSQVTTFNNSYNPTQNFELAINQAAEHDIGGKPAVGEFFNGYLADIHFIDGQALPPSSFGEFDTNGVWQPIDASGLTYGTNGFHLPFSDNSTAAALGTDTSSNGNTWTVNNLSVTAGAGNDSLVDSPTNGSQEDTGVGGEVVGNYATLNPLASAGTFSNGNLEVSVGAAAETSGLATFGLPASGKWYWEVGITAIGSDSFVGISNGTSQTGLGSSYYYYRSIGGAFGGVPTPTSTPSPGATYTTGDIISIAYNADAATLTFYKNNVIQGTFTGVPVGNYFPFAYCYNNANRTVNFGQRSFAYTAPSGFKALCTANLPEPTIADGSTAMDVALYTGNGSTQTISGLNFSPDLVWIKERNNATSHCIFDSVRGTGKVLSSNNTNSEDTTTALSAFNSDGFSLLTPNTGGYAVGDLNDTYAAWTWDAGSSTVTNTEGSITSQVRANASAGFSVMTGSTPASSVNFTFGHNLGIAPSLVIYKHTAVSGNWQVYHRSGGGNNYNLNSTAGPANSGTWSGLDPSSTLITIPSGIVSANSSAFVCYAWAPVSGYSSFGSYTGNGSADGPFVYNGHRVKYLMVKRTDSTGDWFILDGVREPYNYVSRQLGANNSGAESGPDAYNVDFTANGFKLRNSIAGFNASAGSYAYIAFAESPFQYARAR